jgi:hypothetical protein
MDTVLILSESCFFAVFRSSVFGPPGSKSGSVIYSCGSWSFHQQKKMKKNHDFYCFVTALWLIIINDVNVPSKRNKHKKLFLLASWRSLTKRAGSGSASRSVSQKYRPEDPDPDPYQNVTDPEHCLKSSHLVYAVPVPVWERIFC